MLKEFCQPGHMLEICLFLRRFSASIYLCFMLTKKRLYLIEVIHITSYTRHYIEGGTTVKNNRDSAIISLTRES